MPIHEYWCEDCQRIWEDLTLKMSDVQETIKCPVCKKEIPKVISGASFRFGKIFTAGGPTIHDKDGHTSLGMTGEQAQASEKMEHDKRQFIDEGKGGPMEFAISKSPVKEE